MKKFIAALLIGALGLVSTAASCGGSPKDKVGKAIIIAESAYHITVEAELALRCGEVTAPPAPNCIAPEKHAQFKVVLLQIFNPGPPPSGYLQDAKDLYELLPAEGNPNTTQIFAIIFKIGEIVQQVITQLPKSEIASSAAANENVVKTIKEVK